MRHATWSLLLLFAFSLSSCSSGNSESPGSDVTTPDAGLDSSQDVPTADREEEHIWQHGCVDGFCAADENNAPDPTKPGPFPVGVKTFSFTYVGHENQTRKIVVEVWYPATEEAREGPFESIDIKALATPAVQAKMGDLVIQPIPTMTVRDAAMRVADGPYPLILFSHGAYGIRFQNMFYTQLLASHGYVVASPDHQDNTLYDILLTGYNMETVVMSAFQRPGDVYELLDQMLALNSSKGGFFHGSMDEDRIGITGHSFGGFTSLLCPYEDPRFKASVPMTPSTYAIPIWGFEFKDFPIPMMMMTGKKDRTLQTDVEMSPAYELMPAPKYYFELHTGGHYTYTDICSLDLMVLAEELDFGDAEDALKDGCGDTNIPVETAHPLINQFAIGFFNYYLRNSTGSKVYFDEAAAAPHQDDLLYRLEE